MTLVSLGQKVVVSAKELCRAEAFAEYCQKHGYSDKDVAKIERLLKNQDKFDPIAEYEALAAAEKKLRAELETKNAELARAEAMQQLSKKAAAIWGQKDA